jgi:hypothetical protein
MQIIIIMNWINKSKNKNKNKDFIMTKREVTQQ